MDNHDHAPLCALSVRYNESKWQSVVIMMFA